MLCFGHKRRKDDVIKGNLRKFDEFKAQLELRFSDPIRPQQALNEIHLFTQGKMSAQAFLDKFEILKGISGLRMKNCSTCYAEDLHQEL